MVVAGKVFKLSEPLGIADVAERLNDYRAEEEFEEGDYKFSLITEVAGLVLAKGVLRGVFSHDFAVRIFHRGKVIPQPRTVEAVFCFSELKETVFLTVVEKKRTANFVANKLSELLFEKVGNVVEARISPETLKEFHMNNPEDTKITFFDNVDIPNVDKLSLYGPDLTNTSLFDDYAKHGDLWYLVARTKEFGYVVGITRDASVTIFNLAETEKEKYLEYTTKQINPLTA